MYINMNDGSLLCHQCLLLDNRFFGFVILKKCVYVIAIEFHHPLNQTLPTSEQLQFPKKWVFHPPLSIETYFHQTL